MAFDILILTDHSGHTDENSFYGLASSLAGHADVNSVDIASRGVVDNRVFFEGNVDAVLSVIPALPALTFHRASQLFETALSEAEIVDYDFVLLHLPQSASEIFFSALTGVVPEDHIISIGGLKQTRDADGRPVMGPAVDSLVKHLHEVWYGPELDPVM